MESDELRHNMTDAVNRLVDAIEKAEFIANRANNELKELKREHEIGKLELERTLENFQLRMKRGSL